MGVASFALSLVALVFSAIAIGWQIANFFLTGQRVKVDVTGMNVVSVSPQELHEPIIQVTVRATGRVPVEVTGWAVRWPNNQAIVGAIIAAQYGNRPGVFLGDPLPTLIEPGRSASFNIPQVAITQARDVLGLDPHEGKLDVYFSARRRKRFRKSVADLVALPPAPSD